MDLFKQAKETEELIKRAAEAKKKLMAELERNLLALPYNMQIVEANYKERLGIERKDIKVYYPVLEVPQGFTKENEEFYRNYANCVMHEYDLKDERERSIHIEEKVTFDNELYRSKKGVILIEKNHISLPKVNYNISISGKIFSFTRNLFYKDMLEQILKEDKIVIYARDYYNKKYETAEKEYEEFLEELGATTTCPTLEEMYEARQENFLIAPNIRANIEIRENSIGDFIRLENSKVTVRLDDVNTVSVTIEVQPYLNETIELESREYNYFKQTEKEKWEKGITVEEAIELIEEN